MKGTYRVLLVLGLLVIGRTRSFGQHQEPPQGFCVLELFSSEGCASCPPAELLMEKLAHEFRGRPVYVLCYHVDYFNSQAFRDPYSQAACSRRQEAYDRLFHHYVYTPQLVINGRVQTSGYDAYAAYGAIRKQLSVPRTSGLEAKATLDGDSLLVSYRLKHPDPTRNLELALAQDQGTLQRIPAGENAGRELREVRIVRRFSIRPALPGRWSVYVPPQLASQTLSVVLLEQSSPGMRILDVTELPVERSGS